MCINWVCDRQAFQERSVIGANISTMHMVTKIASSSTTSAFHKRARSQNSSFLLVLLLCFNLGPTMVLSLVTATFTFHPLRVDSNSESSFQSPSFIRYRQSAFRSTKPRGTPVYNHKNNLICEEEASHSSTFKHTNTERNEGQGRKKNDDGTKTAIIHRRHHHRRELILTTAVTLLSALFPLHGRSNRAVAMDAAYSIDSLRPWTSMTMAGVEPDVCRNGAIVAENAVPGAYQQECMSLEERSLTLKTTGDTITVYQGTSLSETNNRNEEGSVAGRTGVALWNSGIILTRLLDALAPLERSDAATVTGAGLPSSFFQGKVVLELGCGTAIASIAVSKLGARYIIATDGNEEVLGLAKRNLKRNGIVSSSSPSPSIGASVDKEEWGTGGEATCLQWGLLEVPIDYYDTADIVIGSDLTYNSGNWKVLTETIEMVLAPDGIFLYLTLGHTGFNVDGETNGFLTVVESGGELEVVREGSERWPFRNVASLSRLVGDVLGREEREVVAGTGGFRVVVLRRRRSKKNYKKP